MRFKCNETYNIKTNVNVQRIIILANAHKSICCQIYTFSFTNTKFVISPVVLRCQRMDCTFKIIVTKTSEMWRHDCTFHAFGGGCVRNLNYTSGSMLHIWKNIDQQSSLCQSLLFSPDMNYEHLNTLWTGWVTSTTTISHQSITGAYVIQTMPPGRNYGQWQWHMYYGGCYLCYINRFMFLTVNTDYI